MTVNIIYASRYGTSERLANHLASTLVDLGTPALATPISDLTAPPENPIVLITAIIWDLPIPAMRRWIAAHSSTLPDKIIAVGTVSGAAGVRPEGGLVYARHLARRVGNDAAYQFAMSGEIPARKRVPTWQWVALKLFSFLMRKPQLFSIKPGFSAAEAAAETIHTMLKNNR